MKQPGCRSRVTRRALLGVAGVGAAMGLLERPAQAELPDAGGAPQPLSLDGFVPSFREDFDATADVTAWGPSRWIAHTPWNGDFGEARFTDPGPDQAWRVQDGLLHITARRNSPQERWTSGLLASSDARGRGFRQALGYFEARMRLPTAHGVWPAFWLCATHARGPRAEIDVVEFYGRDPGRYQAVAHVWPNGSSSQPWGQAHAPAYAAARPDAFNLYGAWVQRRRVVFTFNRRPVWTVDMPLDMADQPLTLLLNLAIEPNAVGTRHEMAVDWVAAWTPPAGQ